MTQYHLTKRIIPALGLENTNPVSTPATGPLLWMPGSPPRQEEWNYRSVVGMLQFLCCNTNSELPFNNPRRIHEIAVKRIGRYLKHFLYTDEDGVKRVRGAIFNLSEDERNTPLQLDLWADADFSGCWNATEQHDPNTSRSRTGYAVTMKGLRIIWKSQLQVGIALSTAEAEMGAQSSGMRALIPLRTIFFEIAECFDIPASRMSLVSHAYEDNEACLHIATADPPRLTARNKHWNIKHHWFRSKLGEFIKVLPIRSQEQLADIYTKALTQDLFKACRTKLQGW